MVGNFWFDNQPCLSSQFIQIAVMNADYDKVDYRTTDSPPTNVLRNNKLTEPVAVPEIERDIEKL